MIVQPPAQKEPNAEAYICPMDPEIRARAPGKCSKCGMALVLAGPSTTGEYDLTLECSPAAVKPDEKVRLRFAIFHPKTGKSVTHFQVVHEQLFHLFIVSQDMSHFQHIHPVLEADGRFTIDTVLPKAGHYKVYADFYPAGGTPQVLQRDLVTAGYRGDLFAAQARLTPDLVLTKTVDGIKFELKLDPAQPIAGKPLTLKYHLTDEKTAQPVRDLAPYLGAWGHTIFLSEDQSDYVHSHPSEIVSDAAERAPVKGGPDITFETLLPRPGPYRIWTQFQRGATLTTVSFTIQAARLH
jgi:hypothetical protein